MTLVTAHRILIGSAIALFVFYGSVELQEYADSGATSALVQGGMGLAAAVGFGAYLKTVKPR
jgi:hypothetical protein